MTKAMLACAIILLALGAAADRHAEASIDVSTQILKVDSIIINSVESPSAGWVTIHIDNDGSPGTLLGQTAVVPGANTFLYVTLDMTIIEPRLIAVLRTDRGENGVLELPGPDVPVSRNGQPVAMSFVLHGCRGGILCDL